jgi:two-component system, NarL family, nitrate/nitrite response regulator NarL
VRLILADDHTLFREALCYYLRQCAGDIEIREASDLEGALAAARRETPDLVLLDFVMPGMEGAQGIRRARQELPGIPLVVLSGNISQEEAAEALAAGATSVISKELSGQALREALGRILAGERVVAAPSRKPGAASLPTPKNGKAGGSPPFALTPRELDAVRLLLRGMADKAIAHELGIAAVTVRLHLYHAFRKMGARNRLDAVRIVLQAGIDG